jgi:hypothetical protein
MKAFRLFLPIILFSVIAFSCKKDEEKPDPLASAAGTYNYTIKYNYLDGTNLVYLGTDLDDTGTAIVSKTTDGGFEVKEGGKLVFKGSNVAIVNQDFTFDIVSQTLSFDGTDVAMDGYDGATLGNGKFNGVYQSSTKQLTGYLKFDGILVDENEVEHEVTIVLEFKGTKV